MIDELTKRFASRIETNDHLKDIELTRSLSDKATTTTLAELKKQLTVINVKS